MKKLFLCAIVLMAMSLIISVTGCQQPPVPLPAPPPPFEVSVAPEEAYNLPGEPVEVKFSITNVSSNPITFDPYPPEIQVSSVSQDEVVFSIPAGTQPLEIKPGDTIALEFSWDQKDKEGKQIPPGWCDIIFNDITVMQGSGQSYGLSPRSRVLIQYPQGAMEKSFDLNQSQTINDITVTLERIELTSSGMTVYAFNTPPGHTPPQGILPTSTFLDAFAEYSVDGGVMKQAGSAGLCFLENGTRYTWKNLDPLPADAKELTFRIRMRYYDKPEGLLGLWEFKIPLQEVRR